MPRPFGGGTGGVVDKLVPRRVDGGRVCSPLCQFEARVLLPGKCVECAGGRGRGIKIGATNDSMESDPGSLDGRSARLEHEILTGVNLFKL